MKKILVLASFALLGVAIYFVVTRVLNPTAPKLLVTFMQQIPMHIQNLTGWVQTHLTAIIPTAAGVGTITTLLYNQVYKKAKEKTEQQATEKVTTMQSELLKVTTEKQAAEQTSQQLQTQLSSLQDATKNVTELQNTVASQKKEIDKLIAERNEAERIFKQKYFPQAEEAKVK